MVHDERILLNPLELPPNAHTKLMDTVRARGISEEKIQQAVSRVFDKLKKQSRIDNYITKTASRPVEQISNNDPNAFRKAFPQAAKSPQTK